MSQPSHKIPISAITPFFLVVSGLKDGTECIMTQSIKSCFIIYTGADATSSRWLPGRSRTLRGAPDERGRLQSAVLYCASPCNPIFGGCLREAAGQFGR